MNEHPNTAGAFGGHVGGSADAIRGEIASAVSTPLQPPSAPGAVAREPVARAGVADPIRTDPIRVALLASAGEARDRLGAALADAGAQVTLVADLASIDTEQVRAAEPRALLVALEPAAYDELDRLYQLLADPSLIVIFEEAELVAHRVGWDAARWIRHLGAKLRRHGEVLPPNLGKQEEETRLPERASEDAVAFVGTADTTVADTVQPEEAAPVEAAAAIEVQDTIESPAAVAEKQAEAIEAAQQTAEDDSNQPAIVAEIATSEPLVSQAIAEEQPEAIEVPEPVELSMAAAEGQEQAIDAVELTQDEADHAEIADVAVEQPQLEEEIVELSAEAEPEPQAVLEAANVEDVDSAIEFDASEAVTPRPDFTPLPLVDVDALFASFSEPAKQREPDVAPVHAVASTPQAPVEVAEIIDSSQWALVDDEDASEQPSPLVAEAEAPADVAHELEALEERISGLSLADIDSYGNGPPRGAVVVEAGLGGPDAVRQLLAALPETFARPILVRLQLDGGRYDRLVRQMERVAKLPIALAASERPASPGTVYFMAPGLSLQRKGMELSFVDGAPDAPSEFLAALPGEDSAHLFLSGSDPARIDSAMAHIEARGLLAAQTTDGCYDSTAPAALIARGAVAGTPAELAARLVERWPS